MYHQSMNNSVANKQGSFITLGIRFVSPNISKHSTAGIHSEAEVYKIILNYRLNPPTVSGRSVFLELGLQIPSGYVT